MCETNSGTIVLHRRRAIISLIVLAVSSLLSIGSRPAFTESRQHGTSVSREADALIETDPADVTPSRVTVHSYRIVNSYPHDPYAYTQGLVIQDGVLYEGTGLHGRSSLRRVHLETGKVRQLYRLPYRYYGEGLTVYGDRLIQLTWKSRTGFVYDKNSFELLRTFTYATEGWGITSDGRRLIMSDGTANLYFLDPESFEEIHRIEVHDRGSLVTRLNELEYIRGEIFANVWRTDRIARISAETGRVTGWIDLGGLSRTYQRGQDDVLNGIAYDAQTGRLFITGKLWPKLFEIEVIPPP